MSREKPLKIDCFKCGKVFYVWVSRQSKGSESALICPRCSSRAEIAKLIEALWNKRGSERWNDDNIRQSELQKLSRLREIVKRNPPLNEELNQYFERLLNTGKDDDLKSTADDLRNVITTLSSEPDTRSSPLRERVLLGCAILSVGIAFYQGPIKDSRRRDISKIDLQITCKIKGDSKPDKDDRKSKPDKGAHSFKPDEGQCLLQLKEHAKIRQLKNTKERRPKTKRARHSKDEKTK